MALSISAVVPHCACILLALIAIKGCSLTDRIEPSPPADIEPTCPLALSTDVLERSYYPLVVSWEYSYAVWYEIEVAPSDQPDSYLGLLQTSEHPSGNVTLNLVNARSGGYEIRLQEVGGSTVLARKIVTFRSGNAEPTQGHISLDMNGSLRVNWVSGSKLQGKVKYKSGASNVWLESQEVSSPTTYTPDDLCHVPAAGVGWRDPGYFHSVVIPNEVDLTIIFGSDEGMSKEFKPVNTLPRGDTTPHSVALFGDLGVTGSNIIGGDDGFGELHFGEWSSLVPEAIGSNDDIRLSLLVGDAAYANGFLILWDQFGAEMEASFAMKKAFVVSVGNHEWCSVNNPVAWKPDFTAAYSLGESGGECGVPFKHRYPRSNGTGHVWWFSFDHGLVHYVMMSSEHDFTNGSVQNEWIREDLSKVDRSVTPWVVVTCHRPVYQTCNSFIESGILQHLQSDIEPLLEEFDVDLFVSGHVHRYERTHRIKKTVHTIIGSPRYLEPPCEHFNASWSARVFDSIFGYLEMKVHNSTTLECIFWGVSPDEMNNLTVKDRYVIERLL